jgi:hypothetical protein
MADETRHLARQYARVLAQALFASSEAGAAIVKVVVTTPHPVRGFTHFAQRRLPTTWLPCWSPREISRGLIEVNAYGEVHMQLMNLTMSAMESPTYGASDERAGCPSSLHHAQVRDLIGVKRMLS